MLLNFQGFRGIAPRTAKSLLEPSEGQVSNNVKLYSGEIRSWNGLSHAAPQPIFSFTPKTVYRAYGTRVGYNWMAWDKDVDVVSGPVNDSEAFRVYYTGDGIPKKTNATLAKTGQRNILGPKKWMPLGVPNPTEAPLLIVTADSKSGEERTDSTVIETRVYCYTYVNKFGEIEEETGPSPASSNVDIQPDGEVRVYGFKPPALSPDPNNPYRYSEIRIYRSVKGTTETEWLYVASIMLSNWKYSYLGTYITDKTSTWVNPATGESDQYLSFFDSLTADDLGEPISTLGYEPPPEGLTGLTGMANGMIAGFVKNKIYFTPPYQPHAWPPAFALTVDSDIVGLESYGQSIVIGTKAKPYIATGTEPQQITLEKLPLDAPCVSKRSMASDQNGVMYASTEGVVGVSSSGIDIVTRNVMTQNEWEKYSPSTMLGAIANGRYFLFFQRQYAPFDSGAIVLDRYIQPAPMTTLDFWASAAWVEQRIPGMFLFSNGKLSQWDANEGRPLSYTWRSKYFILPKPVNFGCFTLEADFDEIAKYEERKAQYEADRIANLALMASNVRGAVNSHEINFLEINGSLIKKLSKEVPRYMHLKFYANGILKYETDVKDSKLKRLPSGFADQIWEVQIEGNVPIRQLNVGEVMNDLRSA